MPKIEQKAQRTTDAVKILDRMNSRASVIPNGQNGSRANGNLQDKLSKQRFVSWPRLK